MFGAFVAGPEGGTAAGQEPRLAIGSNTVTPDYFETMKIPVLRGRAFNDHDVLSSTHVVVVNETLAGQFWPNADPIGKRIEIPRISGPPWQVVGVVRDSKYLAVFEKRLPYFYLPQSQNATYWRTFEVRSSLPVDELAAKVTNVIHTLEPEMPIADLHPLREMVDGNIGFVLFRVGVWQATAMGVLGLVLAIIGVYGVGSYRTAQRGREIGIRVALGAMPADVRRLVLRQGAGLVLSGLFAGLLVALAVSQALPKVIVLVSATDPITFVITPIIVTITALVACYLPARRAMRVQAAEVLRHE